MAAAKLGALFYGTGGLSVRAAGDAFLRACARSGLRAWGRCRRRDEDGVTRFRAAAGPAPGVLLPREAELSVDFDAERLAFGGRSWTVPTEKLASGEEDRRLALAGAAAGACGLPDRARGEAAPARGTDSFAAGFDYARANFPARELPAAAGSPRLYLHNGRSAAAAGAIEAGCRAFFSAVPFSELESLASAAGAEAVRASDGEAAVYQAAAAGFCGEPALAVVDERGHRKAEEALLWAARAQLPLVVLVLDAGESAFAQASALYGRSAPGLVRMPSSLIGLYAGAAGALASAGTYGAPVTLLADRLLTERWETIERPAPPAARKSGAGRSARSLARAASDSAAALEEKAGILESEEPVLTGPYEGGTVLAVWGGADAAVREWLEGRGGGAWVITVRALAPLLPPEAYEALRRPARLIAVETTGGQPLRRWVRAASGREAEHLRLTRPFLRETVGEELEGVLG